jgi:hypothetical protein
MGLGGPGSIIGLLLDWAGPQLLISMGLGGPTKINIQWDWVGPAVLLVSFWIGWTHKKDVISSVWAIFSWPS